MSFLSRNPFAVLGASTRDGRIRLDELAFEEDDPAVYSAKQAAARSLSAPRTRLQAEVRWLPGLSPATARRLVEVAAKAERSEVDASQLQPLAAVNFAVAFVETLAGRYESNDRLRNQLLIELVDLASRADEVETEAVQRLLNEDREVAKMPLIAGPEHLMQALDEWRHDVLAAVAAALRGLALEEQLLLVEQLISAATSGGQSHGPLLCHELIDKLEIDFLEMLQEHERRVGYEREVLLAMVARGLPEQAHIQQLGELRTALLAWDRVAQPFQLSAAARGREHEHSVKVAKDVRDVALEAARERGYLQFADHVTKLLHEVVVELRGTAAQLREDADTLAELRQQRSERERNLLKWEQEIQFTGEVGVLVKDRVSVSKDGIRKNATRIALEDVTGLRWGGTKHSVNGIPTHTSYAVAVRSQSDVIQLETLKEGLYNQFVGSLRRAVQWRLMLQMAGRLKAGGRETVGGIVFDDDGVFLSEQKWFSAGAPQHFPWTKVRFQPVAGSLHITRSDNPKFRAEASFAQAWNTHLLWAALEILSESDELTLSAAIEA